MLLSFLFLLGQPLQKALGASGSVVSNLTGVKFGMNVLHVNTHRGGSRIFDMTS